MATYSTLDVISQGEGTTDANALANGFTSGYDVTLGYDAYGPSVHKPVSSMTMAELDSYQTKMLADPANSWNSSAAGKYQITRTTRRSLVNRLGLSDDTIYTPEIQDQMAQELLKDAGVDQYQSGRLDLASYQNNVAGIWASMPNTSGQGSYRGQSAHVSQGELQTSLALDRYNSTGEPVYNSAGELVVDAGGKLVPGASLLTTTNGLTSPTSDDALTVLARNKHYPGYQLSEDQGGVGTIGGPNEEDEITSTFEAPFAPRPNIFQQFSTMTYSVSLYLMGPGQYEKMMQEGRKDVNGLTVFIQSGGINSAGDGTGNHGAKRSEYFHNDFYLDNIRLESLISGTSTMAAHNTFKMNFTITEPAGISFFDRLMKMVQSAYPDQQNYTSHPYLMVVRFYGYDASGNQIYGHDLPELTESRSDLKSVGEKFIPFMFTGIKFQLTEDKIEYACDAVCPQTQVGHDLAHSALMSNVRIKGKTLSQVFGLKSGDKSLGLAEVLNNWQIALVAQGTYEYPDTFKISFAGGIDPEIETIFQGGDKSLYLKSSDMVELTDHREYARSFAGGQIMQTKRKSLHINAGTKITKVIDTIMQTSSYVTKQYLSSTDSTTGELKNKNGKDLNAKDLVWYKIRTVAVPDKSKWDKLRNDFAYNIEYVITPYQFTAESEYANKVKKNCFSIHKEYNYWFTGLNTEVLSFSQEFNYLYYGVTSKKHENKEQESKRLEFNVNNTRRYMHQLASSGNKLNSNNEENEISTNITSELYSPADQANATIDIVGDPDFICQSELFYSPIGQSANEYLTTPFMPDGSVNYDASEVYFTINYNTVVDYDLNTGLADTTQGSLGRDLKNGKAGIAKYSFVYRANTIATQLASGKFTQRLEGTIKIIPEMCTFAMPDTTVNRREDPSAKNTTSSTAGNMNNLPGSSPTSANVRSMDESVQKFPQDQIRSNSAPLPDDDGAFNTIEALQSFSETVRDTPAVSSVTRAITEPAKELQTYYTEAVDEVQTFATNAATNARRFTSEVFTTVDDLGSDLQDAFNNTSDEDNT